MKASDSGFIQYLLLLIGATCLVVSSLNFARHQTTQELENRRSLIAHELSETRKQVHLERRKIAAFDSTPAYREQMVREQLGLPQANSRALDSDSVPARLSN